MATSKNGLTPDKGPAGNYTFYERDGVTIVRTAHNLRTKEGRTTASMDQRTKMSNLVSNWRTLKFAIEDCYETRKPTANPYNGFVAANFNRSRVHLSREEAEWHYAVAEPFIVSLGTLDPPVQVSLEENLVVSDLAVTPLPMGLDSGMLDFAVALLRGNYNRLEWGDIIRYVRLQQKFDLNTHHPYVSVYCFEIPLSQNEPRTVRQYLAGRTFTEGFDFTSGRLTAPRHADSLSTWIVLRPQRNKRPRVTNQMLRGDAPWLQKYASEEHLQEAILSYGPLEDKI